MLHAEYWILHTAVEAYVPLRFTVRPDLERLFNKPGHGLNRRELISLLLTLFDSGRIVARISEPDLKGDEFLPTRLEVERALNEDWDSTRRGGLCYGLTTSGGRRWEAAAQADWNHYIADFRELVDESEDSSEVQEAEIITTDAKRLETYISLLRDGSDRIEPGTEKEDVLRPWHATYWKALPVGYRVRFRVIHDPKSDFVHIDQDEELDRLTSWYVPLEGTE